VAGGDSFTVWGALLATRGESFFVWGVPLAAGGEIFTTRGAPHVAKRRPPASKSAPHAAGVPPPAIGDASLSAFQVPAQRYDSAVPELVHRVTMPKPPPFLTGKRNESNPQPTPPRFSSGLVFIPGIIFDRNSPVRFHKTMLIKAVAKTTVHAPVHRRRPSIY
jgi:hypothetical protein